MKYKLLLLLIIVGSSSDIPPDIQGTIKLFCDCVYNGFNVSDMDVTNFDFNASIHDVFYDEDALSFYDVLWTDFCDFILCNCFDGPDLLYDVLFHIDSHGNVHIGNMIDSLRLSLFMPVTHVVNMLHRMAVRLYDMTHCMIDTLLCNDYMFSVYYTLSVITTNGNCYITNNVYIFLINIRLLTRYRHTKHGSVKMYVTFERFSISPPGYISWPLLLLVGITLLIASLTTGKKE